MEPVIHSIVPEVSMRTFEALVTRSPIPVLLVFTAKWCSACKDIAPIIEEFYEALKGKVAVYNVISDTNMPMLNKFGIDGIPTLILFKAGIPYGIALGNLPLETFLEMIDNALVAKQPIEITPIPGFGQWYYSLKSFWGRIFRN